MSFIGRTSLALSAFLAVSACAMPQGQGGAFTGSPYNPRPVDNIPDNGTLLGGVAGQLTQACNQAVGASDPDCLQRIGAGAGLIHGLTGLRLP